MSRASHHPPAPGLHLLLSSPSVGSALGDLLLFNRGVLGRSSLGADLPGAAAGGQVSCSGWLLGLFLLLAPLQTDSCSEAGKKKKAEKPAGY